MKNNLTSSMARLFKESGIFKPVEAYSKEQLEQAYKRGYESGFSDGQSAGFNSAIDISKGGKCRIERVG